MSQNHAVITKSTKLSIFLLSIDLGSVGRFIHSFWTSKQLIFVNYVQYLRYLQMRTPFSIMVCTCLLFTVHRSPSINNHQLNDGYHRVFVIFFSHCPILPSIHRIIFISKLSIIYFKNDDNWSRFIQYVSYVKVGNLR